MMGTIGVTVKKNDKCQICKIPMIFSDFEKDVTGVVTGTLENTGA